MSMTFFAPDAPTIQVAPYDDEPGYVEERSTLPELNLSNTNAYAFLRLLDIEPDHCGQIAVSEMDELISRCMRLANSQASRRPALREPERHQRVGHEVHGNLAVITRGCVSMDCGLSDEQVQRYAAALQSLLMQARQHGFAVNWG